MNAQDIWNATLGELQLQMTKATFDQWVRGTSAITFADGVMTVQVNSTHAKEWLENRLSTTIQRTLTGVVGGSVELRYEVKSKLERAEPTDTEADKPGDVIVSLIESPLVPFIQVQKYAIWYWQPLVGHIPFAVWNLLRTMDKQNNGEGGRHRISVEILADTIGVHRQQITGRSRKGKNANGIVIKEWDEGAFDVLNREGLARIEPIGEGRNTIWWARILNGVPYLTPKQVAKLPALVQERHDKFLRDFAIPCEQWEQISLPSLVPQAQGNACATGTRK